VEYALNFPTNEAEVKGQVDSDMKQINAFIGHSFSPEDKDVVRAFLDFFEEIKNMGIGFNWEHAEAAETKELAEKVLRVIEDKNLFIGICTRKEKAISADMLKPTWWFSTDLKAPSTSFLWKTSDWILQEIGLALGRSMDLMLLVEEGVRRPGGFQGNREYITFNRQAPERSYKQILETVRSLIPKPVGTQGVTLETVKAQDEPAPAHEDEGSDWLEPKPSWDKGDFRLALSHMVMVGDLDGENKISDAYLSTPDGQQEHNKLTWAAGREYLKIRFGKGGSLTKLEAMSRNNSNNSRLQYYLARSYQVYGEDSRAGDTLRIAAQIEQDEKQKLAFLSDAAVAHTRSKDVNKKKSSIEELQSVSVGIEGGEAILTDTLRQIADIENDKESYLAYSEYLLDLRPDDNDLRFKLAYEYSQQNRSELSLCYYMKIPYPERSPVAWNNIGVADARLDLHSLAVDAYRKSEELGETLAMSNLALKLMAAGFLKEAHETCDRAIQIKDYHKNVGDTIYQIKKAREEETEKQQKIFSDVKPYSEFYRDYGRAAAKAALAEEHGIWQGPKCKLNVTITKNQFRAEGTYEVPEFGLGSLSAFLLPGTAPTGQPKSVTHTFKIDGVIRGQAIMAKISEGKEGELNTLLTGSLNTRVALMILSEDRSEIQVYEKDPPNAGKLYSMTRVR